MQRNRVYKIFQVIAIIAVVAVGVFGTLSLLLMIGGNGALTNAPNTLCGISLLVLIVAAIVTGSIRKNSQVFSSEPSISKDVAEVPAETRVTSNALPELPSMSGPYSRTITGVGAAVLLGAAFLDWPTPAGKAMGLGFGGLLLIGALLTQPSPGEPYSEPFIFIMAGSALFCLLAIVSSGGLSNGAWVGLLGSVVALIGCWLKAPWLVPE